MINEIIKNNTIAYNDFETVYSMIASAKNDCYKHVNKSLIVLYWSIGQYVSRKSG